MKEDLHVPDEYDGGLWSFTYPGSGVILHHHDELEVNIVTRGTARYLIGDRRYDLARNTQIWLFPEQDHLLFDQSPDFAMWIGVFKRPLLQRVCVTPETRVLLEDSPAHLYSTRLTHEQANRLGALCCEVAGAQDDRARYNAGLAYCLLVAWATQASTEGSPGRGIHPAVEKAAFLIRDEPEILAVSALAARVGLSSSRLSRLFKEQMDMSLVRYRNRQCLARFLQLYGQGRTISMTEAMLEAGFGSYPQFYRIFRGAMGCGPADYHRALHKPA